jgi:hypothetical protein
MLTDEYVDTVRYMATRMPQSLQRIYNIAFAEQLNEEGATIEQCYNYMNGITS